MTSGSDWPRSSDLASRLHGVELVVVGLDDFGGHDPAHEEDGPWGRKGQIESQVKTHICVCISRGIYMRRDTHTHTCPPVSNDKEERVIGHDLWVQHQSPGQGDHS